MALLAVHLLSEPWLFKNMCYLHKHQLLPAILQVWNGHWRESEHVILDAAVALRSFWVDNQPEVRLAVAAAQHVYIYIGTKVHYKITLPFETVQQEDEAAWYGSLGTLHCPSTFHDHPVRDAVHCLHHAGVLQYLYQCMRCSHAAVPGGARK